jgi:hypothetical protein
MGMRNPMLAAAFIAVAASVPALCAERAVNAPPSSPSAKESDDACLQNNRLWSWQVVNPRTLSITDRTQKRFTVRVASGCVGLTNLIQAIEIRGLSELSCVRRGDFVRFVEPSLGRMSCTITSVERATR